MLLDELPDLVLHEICLYLEAKDITSLLKTNEKLFNHIRANRLYYRRYYVPHMRIWLPTKDQRTIIVSSWDNKKDKCKEKTLTGLVNEVMKSFSPSTLSIDDHELANMHPMWWRGGTKSFHLHSVVDYQQYLPFFDRFTDITLQSDVPIKLAEILASMETKNQEGLGFFGKGEVHCTDDDLRKIGRLSNNMKCLYFENLSESSNISNDAILDMLEIGYFADNVQIFIPRLQNDMNECLKKRSWVKEINWFNEKMLIIGRYQHFSIHIRVK